MLCARHPQDDCFGALWRAGAARGRVPGARAQDRVRRVSGGGASSALTWCLFWQLLPGARTRGGAAPAVGSAVPGLATLGVAAAAPAPQRCVRSCGTRASLPSQHTRCGVCRAVCRASEWRLPLPPCTRRFNRLHEEGVVGSAGHRFVQDRVSRQRPRTPGDEVGQALVLGKKTTTLSEVRGEREGERWGQVGRWGRRWCWARRPQP